MSKQLALSSAFSIFMMAIYVLFGADSVRAPLTSPESASESPVQISAPELPGLSMLIPSLR